MKKLRGFESELESVSTDRLSWAVPNTIGDWLLLDGGTTKTDPSAHSTDVLVLGPCLRRSLPRVTGFWRNRSPPRTRIFSLKIATILCIYAPSIFKRVIHFHRLPPLAVADWRSRIQLPLIVYNFIWRWFFFLFYRFDPLIYIRSFCSSEFEPLRRLCEILSRTVGNTVFFVIEEIWGFLIV